MNVTQTVSTLQQLKQEQQVVISIHGRLYDFTISAPAEDAPEEAQKVLLVPVDPPALRKFAEE